MPAVYDITVSELGNRNSDLGVKGFGVLNGEN